VATFQSTVTLATRHHGTLRELRGGLPGDRGLTIAHHQRDVHWRGGQHYGGDLQRGSQIGGCLAFLQGTTAIVSSSYAHWVQGGVSRGGVAAQNHASLVLSSSRVEGCYSELNGGGVDIEYGPGIISDTQVVNNIVSSAGPYGGGIFVSTSNTTVSRCNVFRERHHFHGTPPVPPHPPPFSHLPPDTIRHCPLLLPQAPRPSAPEMRGSRIAVWQYRGQDLRGVASVTWTISLNPDAAVVYPESPVQVNPNAALELSQGGGMYVTGDAVNGGTLVTADNCLFQGNKVSLLQNPQYFRIHSTSEYTVLQNTQYCRGHSTAESTVLQRTVLLRAEH